MSKHIHKQLRKKLHSNRYLAWAIAVIVIIALSLLAYIHISEINFEAQMGILPQTNFQAYTNQALGFSLEYPKSWGIEPDVDQTINFVPRADNSQGFSVSVFNPSDEKALVASLSIAKQEQIKLGNETGKKITNKTKLGNETIIIAKHNNRLYIIRGNVVPASLLTFKFTN